MKLNQAQVVALYSLCTELGFGSHIGFQVMSQEEESGDIVVDVTGDILASAGRYKLFEVGGREFISGSPKPDLHDPAVDSAHPDAL